MPVRSGLTGSAKSFRPSTSISYAVAVGASAVSLDIVDVSGRKVRTLIDGAVEPGFHSVTWDGRSDQGRAVSGSVHHFARLRVGKEESTRKLLRVVGAATRRWNKTEAANGRLRLFPDLCGRSALSTSLLATPSW
ncbi:MAG: FlgD immunoglobulin-like domain containing protein [Candidatus Eisenbacteria bacterium]